MRLIECIANFSEGKNQIIINKIADSITKVKGVSLLHSDSGIAANRTVYTFAGEAELVLEAAYNAIKIASQEIDMQHHQGEHPRIGACDVCPFVPISGINKAELIPMVENLAKRIADEKAAQEAEQTEATE